VQLPYKIEQTSSAGSFRRGRILKQYQLDRVTVSVHPIGQNCSRQQTVDERYRQRGEDHDLTGSQTVLSDNPDGIS
jgi:hypothetical protein